MVGLDLGYREPLLKQHGISDREFNTLYEALLWFLELDAYLDDQAIPEPPR